MPEIRIQPRIFEQYPAFRRGIVIAKNLDNQNHSRELKTRSETGGPDTVHQQSGGDYEHQLDWGHNTGGR
jgi:hypothetical protein